jgi:hypothetical protein
VTGVAPIVAPWLAAILAAGAIVLAIAALTARSLFVMSIALSGVAGLAAGVLLALGAGDGALNLVLVGAGLAPIILLAGVLLSARAAKAQQRGVLWLCLAAVALAVAAVAAIAPELLNASTIARPANAPSSVWLAVLIATVATAVAALLGYDERGVLESRRPRIEP